MNALDLIYVPLAIATAPIWLGKRRSGWDERFGKIPPLPVPERPRLLLHAVSVGEVNALRTLVPLLVPDFDLVVSATTDTGLKRARDLFSAHAHVVRYALDFSWCVRRFLDAVRPDAIALVELEIWPNFIDECGRRGIPVAVVNGRLSDRSYRGYAKIKPFIARRVQELAFVAVQDLDYAGRFQGLGLPADKCLITGSMKWDAAGLDNGPQPGAEDLASSLGISRERPLIVAGSTGPGEEALLLRSLPPGCQLLCAPRKPERFEEAARDLPGCVRRSRTRESGPPPGEHNLFLLDSIGELRLAYSLADIVVIGRSFMGDLYGSDPIEAVALGKATVMGPYVSDFEQVVRILTAAGGLRCTDRENLATVLASLVANEEERRAIAQRGLEAVRVQMGASRRNADLLRNLLPQGSSLPTIGHSAGNGQPSLNTVADIGLGSV